MATQITPLTPAIPPTTAIEDPAVRQFANAVRDVLQAYQSPEVALQQLTRAAEQIVRGGTPPSIARWLFSSELYLSLVREIKQIDIGDQQALVNAYIDLLNDEGAIYDPSKEYSLHDLVVFEGKLYRATGTTQGDEPPDQPWEEIGRSSGFGDTIAAIAIYETKTRAAIDEAIAESVSALSARTDANEAAIVDEATVRATNDNALVQAINTAWAFTGATNAVSQSGQNLITNWTAAQANRWSQLEAEVFTAGGKTIRAALAEEAQVRANADGQLYGQYTVKIDLDGYVAGFGLASESSTAGAQTSAFVIRADKFAVVMPGFGEHVPFAIGPSGAEFTGQTNWSNVTGTGKPEDGATKNTVYRQNTTPSGATNGDIWIDTSTTPHTERIRISGAWQVASTVGATFNASQPGTITGQITGSNVTTYIANAAIQNAQIGNVIESNNYIPGISGWHINKDGQAEFRNIFARGNIEATSIKVDALEIVNTANLAGNSVTVSNSTSGSSITWVSTSLTVPAGQTMRIIGMVSAVGDFALIQIRNTPAYSLNLQIDGVSVGSAFAPRFEYTALNGDSYNGSTSTACIGQALVNGPATVVVRASTGLNNLKTVVAFGMLR